MAASARITKAWDKSAPSTAPRGALTADQSGRPVGSYRLVRLLGQGGMGAVYEAVHQQLPRRVAIKLLGPEFASEPELLERFFNEARAVNIVQHPDIISISELGQLSDGTAYLVMELLQGEALSARMHRLGKLPVSEAVRIGRQIALALAAAHDKRIVHRDLKPDNVMLVADADSPGGERVKLLDFGIAKLAEEHQGARQVKTRSGVVLGTPIYMSPEQCRGAAEVDHKADVYSLGVMLYQMLAGRPPFEAEGEGELMAMHIYEEPTPVRERVPLVPEELSALVQQMLDKDRAQRPTMAEVAARLEQLGGRPLGPLLVTPLLPMGPPDEPAGPQTGPPPLHDTGPGPIEVTPARPEAPPSAALASRRRWQVVPVLLLVGITIAGLLRPARRSPPAPLVTEPPPLRIRWSLVTEPPGADIVRVADGKVLSRTPFVEERVAAPGALRVVLRKEGYVQKLLELDLSAHVMIREVLQPLPELRRPARPRTRMRHLAPAAARVSPPAAPTPPAPPEVQDFEKVLRAKVGHGEATEPAERR